MSRGESMHDLVLIDEAGWGDLILGSVVGALRLPDKEYMEHRIPTSSFQQPNFDKEKYLDDAEKIAEEIVDAMEADNETVFKIRSGKVLAKIHTHLKNEGFNIQEVEETDELQKMVERSYMEWCMEAGVPREHLESEERFWRLLDWVIEKPGVRGKLVKTGWGTRQLSFINHETLVKVAKVLGGEEGTRIVEVLSHVNESKDVEIVAKTGIKLNTVRKILYRLYDHSIVGLRRTRNKDTGWFIFHWRLQPEQIDCFLINQKKSILEKLEIRLNYEKNHNFYSCHTSGCRRLTFEEAVENVFKCPKCGKHLTYYDNKNMIGFLNRKIKQLKNELDQST